MFGDISLQLLTSQRHLAALQVNPLHSFAKVYAI